MAPRWAMLAGTAAAGTAKIRLAGSLLAAALAGLLCACQATATGAVSPEGSTGTAGGPSAAKASAPRCGSVLTASTILRADVTGCPGDGLVIGADGITLNLNGHKVTGGSAAGPSSGFGIHLTGRHGVTITGGTVDGFERGVWIDGGDGNTVARMTGTGMTKSAIAVTDSTGNVISGNTTHADDVGIYVSGGSRNQVKGNSSYGNAQGITLDISGLNVITGNRASRDGDGIIVAGSGNQVRGNTVSATTGCGDQGCGYGISVEAGAGNVIEGNAISATLLDGIRVAAFDPDLPTRGTTVTKNRVSGAKRDGIEVGIVTGNPVGATTLTANDVTGSAADGIHVGSKDTTLARNHASRNGRLGIEAVPGVRDGGGNVAHLNGGSAQCADVACRP